MTRWAVTVPPSANRTWRYGNGHHHNSSEYTAWLRLAGTELIIQRAKPISGPVSVTLYAPNNGRRDIDNFIKPTLDLLCKQNLIDGDRFKTVKRVSAEWHTQPAMLIEVLPFGAN